MNPMRGWTSKALIFSISDDGNQSVSIVRPGLFSAECFRRHAAL
ncbi:hypothetical protein EHYA_06681 [Embleya hyalina]|uniref:Uncharacterized protein n=1 Tax=Embleya hyalina TaxID=516124 RepID=A0A401YWK8_9ACTN|nr:hypothetical protein EHYA_06681 [Embleya hyalina]